MTYDTRSSDLSPSAIMQQLAQNFELISPFFYSYPVNIFLYGLRALAILVLLARMSWQLTIMVGVLIPIFVLVSERYAERLSGYQQRVVNNMQEQRDYLVDSSKLSKMQRFFTGSLLSGFNRLEHSYIHDKELQVKTTSFFENFLSYSFLNVMIMLASIISAYQVFTNQITIGEYLLSNFRYHNFGVQLNIFLLHIKIILPKHLLLMIF